IALAGVLGSGGGGPGMAPSYQAVVLPRAARDSMNAIFSRFNQHWNELQDVNTLTQMLGTGKPTQREYLGCLEGAVSTDTLWIRRLAPARGLRQLQFAVTGDCGHVKHLVGTWHTHPYRASPDNLPLKEPALSTQDLATFAASSDLVSLVVWDVDSLDAAIKNEGGQVIHPGMVIVR
ncbi:MAG: hypothetical protein ACREMO_00500, partial [Gemmatimonadales bacterium]